MSLPQKRLLTMHKKFLEKQ